MYLISNWIVDGINNKLYKYTNDILEESYDIHITKPIGYSAITVSTNESSILITCPTIGSVMEFDTGSRNFIRSTNVGGTPLGICEGVPYGINDERNPYFVTNYTNNSVTIIKDGKIVQTINVGFGPRSIATNKYGIVYVANYLDNTVSILTPKDNKYILFKTINVESHPIAIAVNFNNDVYVACKNSIIKIIKNNKIKRFSVYGRPTSLATDKYGNIWSTNNIENSIIKINNQEIVESFSTESEGPMYCCSDRDGDIIILSTVDNKITRLNEDGSFINSINLDFIPIGNGDFIGLPSRINIINDIDDDKIGWNDLNDSLKNIISHGGIDPETLILNSDNITFENDEYDNVTQALNGIIYEKTELLNKDIEKFEIIPSIVEKGSTVDQITFNYKINTRNGISSAKIDNGIGDIPVDGTTYTVSNLSITNDTNFNIIGMIDSGYKGIKTASIKFDNKIYLGLNSNIINTAEGILALSNYEFVEDTDLKIYNRKLSIGNGIGYIYIAIPSYIGITYNDFTTSGFKDSNWETLEIPIEINGETINYTLFRSGYIHNLMNIFIEIEIIKNK